MSTATNLTRGEMMIKEATTWRPLQQCEEHLSLLSGKKNIPTMGATKLVRALLTNAESKWINGVLRVRVPKMAREDPARLKLNNILPRKKR